MTFVRCAASRTSTRGSISSVERLITGRLLVASTRGASHEVQSGAGRRSSPRGRRAARGAERQSHRRRKRLGGQSDGCGGTVLETVSGARGLRQRPWHRVEAVTSANVAQRIRTWGVDVTLRPRSEARAALADARVVLHISDGARFPSFAIAALAAGVPTIARATAINRELLGGAAALAEGDDDVCRAGDLWEVPPVGRSPSPPDALELKISLRPPPHARTSRSIAKSCEAGSRDSRRQHHP